jgi:hypothetical protein
VFYCGAENGTRIVRIKRIYTDQSIGQIFAIIGEARGLEMGDTLTCNARFKGQVSAGKVLLETDEIIFRGDFRVAIPLKQIKSVSAQNGDLEVVFPQGTLTLELGPAAEKWANKIRNPKSLLDKLGIKSGSKVSVLGIKDQAFWSHLDEKGIAASRGRPRKGSDMILLAAEDRKALKKIASLKDYIVEDGAIWVVSPKGQQHIREADVLAGGKAAGLVDVKIARFSATHTALKFVIPRSARSSARENKGGTR